METVRTRQLRKLASSLPGGNEKVAQGLQEARKTQLQAQVGAAAPGTGGPAAAQQLGAQQAQAAGQIAMSAQGQTQQDLGQVAKLGLQQSALESAQRLGAEERAQSALARKNAQRLTDLSESAKDQILDKQLQFKKDQANQTLLNNRQLADWALTKARSEEEYRNYEQMATQASQRRLQYLETVYARLEQMSKSGYAAEDKKLDFESQKQIKQMAQRMAKKIQQAKTDAAVKAAAWQAGGSILGAAVGGMATRSPGGAQTGAGIGGGAGKSIGSTV